jgi:hypothetical protein
MTDQSDINDFSDELMADLLTAFGAGQYWTDLTQHRQVASEIIRQQLTVRFHAFVQARLSD